MNTSYKTSFPENGHQIRHLSFHSKEVRSKRVFQYFTPSMTVYEKYVSYFLLMQASTLKEIHEQLPETTRQIACCIR
jgi:hypothetical protein